MLICLLSTIGPEGLSGKPAAALADAIVQAAARLGARWQTPDTLRKLAGQQVDEIVERVKSSGQRGKLKHWNTRYRQYRLAQVAKAEKAIPYSSFLEQVVINADRARRGDDGADDLVYDTRQVLFPDHSPYMALSMGQKPNIENYVIDSMIVTDSPS